MYDRFPGADIAPKTDDWMRAGSGGATQHHLLRHSLPTDNKGATALSHFGAATVAEAGKTIKRMSQRDLQNTFRAVYGTRTFSNNNNWLRRKLCEAIGIDPGKGPSAKRSSNAATTHSKAKRRKSVAPKAHAMSPEDAAQALLTLGESSSWDGDSYYDRGSSRSAATGPPAVGLEELQLSMSSQADQTSGAGEEASVHRTQAAEVYVLPAPEAHILALQHAVPRTVHSSTTAQPTHAGADSRPAAEAAPQARQASPPRPTQGMPAWVSPELLMQLRMLLDSGGYLASGQPPATSRPASRHQPSLRGPEQRNDWEAVARAGIPLRAIPLPLSGVSPWDTQGKPMVGPGNGAGADAAPVVVLGGRSGAVSPGVRVFTS
ncbi:hypothetical protein APUTEX25_005070 [Auxenochlorella protothecoides]|nr:hypothetical protein APUTEX25_005070 [Auxenochlorella protothecoides]|eukprot:RMZ52317.1 hypothetical protein APUTEX25_005070 [Auxenochlorella protothecoides]